MFFYNSPRQKKEFSVRECGREEWKKFRRYHYLNSDLANNSKCFGLYDGESIVGFCAIIKYPHPVNKNIVRVHRIVILPDYQGCGLGTRFLNMIAKLYTESGKDFFFSTSQRSMIYYCQNNEQWKCVRIGKSPKPGKNSKLSKSFRTNVMTASFIYKK